MADEISSDHADLLSQFVAITATSEADAMRHLIANHWDLNAATTEYYTALEEGGEGAQGGESEPEEPYTGPRTLDGRPAPQAIPTVGSSSAPPKKRGGIATLGSLGSAGSSGHGHSHDDDDSDDGDFTPGEQPRDLFAGGEKSGLAVQDPSNRSDPRKVVEDILKKAKANAQRPGGESSSSAPPSRFRGGGMTLGGDDTPSQAVPDPNPRRPVPTGPPQTRVLHLWEDGFSIEDGPLRRFDDPQNAADLQMIRGGHAPLHLMGVQPNQPIDVQLVKHEEAYKAPPKVYKPFSGSGQRLGSPTPSGSSTTQAPEPAAPAASTSSGPPVQEVDSSQPTLSLRLQLADGSRLPARFNATHTIGDVYDFINRSYPGSSARAWVLATTFPNKDHTDKSLALGDVAEFKRGGTAVQKWT